MNDIHNRLVASVPWYAKWHEKPHHHRVHIGILIVVIAVVVFSLSGSNRGIAQQYVMSDLEKMEFAERNGLVLLKEGDYAVATDPKVKASKDRGLTIVRMKNGDRIQQEYGDNLIANVIEYEAGVDTYVMKSDPNISLHNIYDYAGYESYGKVEKAATKKLKREGKVSVIVEMNLKEKKYYDKNDSQSSRAAKKQDFEQGKSSVVASVGASGKVKHDLQIINGLSMEVRNEKALEALGKNPKVKRVTLDRPKQLLLNQSVPQLHAPEVYGFTDQMGQALTGNGIRVAVIDTGVDYRHPDLGGCLGATCKVIGGRDFVFNDNDPMDDNGHGTHVAATVAGQGVLDGVAPDAKILAYKVCAGSGCDGGAMIAAWNASVDPNGDGDPSDHADIATVSIGGDCPIPLNDGCGPNDPLSLTVDNATAAGVLSTIAAGNSGPTPGTVNSPGTSRTALTVAAACKTVDIGGTGTCATPIASFSSRGPSMYNGENIGKPEISAPGVRICAAKLGSPVGGNCVDGAHYYLSGTSMATPHIAGVAALVKQANPTYTPAQVKQRIIDTATPLGGNLTANDQGAGIANVAAAIPLISEISSNPKLLRITTNPTGATHTTTQNFTSTGMNATVGTVNVEFTSPVPGITFTSSKQTLNLANLGSDTFTATFKVDNNTVKPGSYPTSIFFTQNGVKKGAIPVQVIVVPTIVADQEQITYGNFDPSLSSWQSANKSVTYTNKRTDIAQTLTLSASSFASGITYQYSPTTLTIPAGGSTTVSSSFSANNAVALGTYSGVLSATNGANDVKVGIKFTKLHVLEITDTSSASALAGAIVGLNSRDGSFRVFGSVPGNPFTISLPGVTLVDFWIRYGSEVPGYVVVREGVSVSGTTRVSISKTEAKNLVKIIGTDKDGQNRQVGHKLFNLLDAATGRMRLSSIWIFGNDVYVSNISNESALAIATIPTTATAQNVYMYGGQKTGLTSDWIITNTPSDLKKIDFFNHNNIPGQSYSPNLFSCMGPSIYDCIAFSGDSIQQGNYTDPGLQVLYSTRPKNFYVFQDSNLMACESVQGEPCQIEFVSPAVDTFTGIRKTWSVAVESLAWPDSGKIYNGLAPQVLFGKGVFSGDGYYLATVYPAFPDLRQDFAEPPATPMIYTLKQNGTIVGQGGLGEGIGCHSGGFCIINALGQISGQAELTVPYVYKAKGLSMNALFKLTFDTTKSDIEPPYATALFFYTDNARSEVYDPAKQNKIVAHLNPGGGAMQGVTFSYSTDGNSFTPFASSASEGVYTANIPQLPSAAKGIFRVKAADVAGNTYEFTFELPQGTVAHQVDTVSPYLMLTAPQHGTNVTGIVPINVTASDNVGVVRVDFFKANMDADGVDHLIGSDTTAPYSFDWNTANEYQGYGYRLRATATDAAGNTGLSTNMIGVRLSGEPTPVDTIPPTISISSPQNGATISGTTTITTNASDNIGIDHVDFYRGSTLIGADAIGPQYSYAWDTTSAANGAQTITAKAYDAAGNNTTSSGVSVTVNNGTTPPPDTTAPTVSLTSPENGTTVSGPVTLAATASDNVGVTKVSFYYNGTLIDTDTTGDPNYAITWTSTSVADGGYTLTARAYDAANNVTTSSSVAVTVRNDVTPPPTDWTLCAQEGETCSYTGTKEVRYGANDTYFTQTLPGPVACTNETFGDPIFGVVKSCWYRSSITPPDTIAPTVDLTAPSNGATVSGSVSVSASASDNVGVDHVDFYRGSTLIGGDATAPYSVSWNTTSVANGSQTLTAKAYDAAGNFTTSSAVSVTVNNGVTPPPPSDTTAPTVSLTAPANGALVSGNVTISAVASDNVGVTKVEFYRSGSLIDTDTTASSGTYAVTWKVPKAKNKRYTLTAKAYDAAGNTKTSSSIEVTSN